MLGKLKLIRERRTGGILDIRDFDGGELDSLDDVELTFEESRE